MILGVLGYVTVAEIRIARTVHRDQRPIAKLDLQVVGLAGVATVDQVYVRDEVSQIH